MASNLLLHNNLTFLSDSLSCKARLQVDCMAVLGGGGDVFEFRSGQQTAIGRCQLGAYSVSGSPFTEGCGIRRELSP